MTEIFKNDGNLKKMTENFLLLFTETLLKRLYFSHYVVFTPRKSHTPTFDKNPIKRNKERIKSGL